MLKRIKTSYFLKIVFYHLSELLKLKIAKYSKYLQKDLDRKIIHYKSFSGRYIIYQKEGKGKEFSGYSDKLIYEGEYLNRERHGKGKEYDSFGNLMFEGEYINGIRNGKGKQCVFLII